MNNNITDDYCSFEVSKLLKEKGFEWSSNTLVMKEGRMMFENITGVAQSMDNAYNCYEENGKPIRPRKYTPTNSHYPRPTHSLAIKWIRENFKFNISTDCNQGGDKWKFKINLIDKGDYIDSNDVGEYPFYSSSDEATEIALLYTLSHLIK